MEGSDLISEKEAAEIAGISLNTLLRFVEAGYLQSTSNSGESKMFSKAELQTLFGITPEREEQEKKLREKVEVSKVEKTTQSPTPSTNTNQTNQSPHQNPTSSVTKPSPIPTATIATAQNSDTDRKTERLSSEVYRLQTIIDLQERLLDQKDNEIKLLKEEGSWLKERIEKLEDKGDRDQILLMTKTQMITKLMELQDQRPKLDSPFRRAISWLGGKTNEEG